jgi:hypothetical protein
MRTVSKISCVFALRLVLGRWLRADILVVRCLRTDYIGNRQLGEQSVFYGIHIMVVQHTHCGIIESNA